MASCPECGGKMKFNPSNRHVVCTSCGLSLTRYELEHYWKSIKAEQGDFEDDFKKEKSRRKEWLEWWASRKE